MNDPDGTNLRASARILLALVACLAGCGTGAEVLRTLDGGGAPAPDAAITLDDADVPDEAGARADAGPADAGAVTTTDDAGLDCAASGDVRIDSLHAGDDWWESDPAELALHTLGRRMTIRGAFMFPATENAAMLLGPDGEVPVDVTAFAPLSTSTQLVLLLPDDIGPPFGGAQTVTLRVANAAGAACTTFEVEDAITPTHPDPELVETVTPTPFVLGDVEQISVRGIPSPALASARLVVFIGDGVTGMMPIPFDATSTDLTTDPQVLGLAMPAFPSGEPWDSWTTLVPKVAVIEVFVEGASNPLAFKLPVRR